MAWYKHTPEPRDYVTNTRKAPAPMAPASEHTLTVYPAEISIKRYDAAWARGARKGSYTARPKSTLSGKVTGSNFLQEYR